ncbi:MAG TPA: TIGR02117 family protein [Allosphingosinicella sp.]|nr:TIGR02117 family protein [Allosphingosinicella sp.]
MAKLSSGQRRALVWALRIVAGVVAVPLIYFAAALFLGLIPANVAFRQPPPGHGITIYVRSNGVHTDIVMPKVNAEMDWRPYADPAHLREPRWGNADHVAIGYGNREFYLNTPTWGDLSLGVAFTAMLGGGTTLLHVEHIDRPGTEDKQRPIRLAPDQYRRLVAFIRERFRLGPDGRPIPVPGRGYGPYDAFYEANGGFSAILNCNEWTGRALRAAGVRMGLWTPMEQSVMWRLD